MTKETYAALETLSIVCPDDGTFPNSVLPVVVFRQAFVSDFGVDPAAIERIFSSNRWTHSWRNGLYTYPHYHSISHEVLGLYAGRVKVQFGGPKGTLVEACAGDVVVIPAGVAHQNLDQSRDFQVIGAYPDGRIPDMKLGRPGERPASDENIRHLPLPSLDPLSGAHGPLMELWGKDK